MIFETHAHYDDKAFDDDRDQLIKSFPENGIGIAVNISSDIASVKKTIELTKKYSYLYGAVGIHPSETEELTEDNFLWLKEQCFHEKIVAVGEIGLDYHWKDPEAAVQKKWFERQLLLAQEINLPIVIHSREAAKDTLDILKAVWNGKQRGVVHCFSYVKEIAAEFLKYDFYFGIGGVVTFPNAKKLKEVVDWLPIEKIVLETDSPYLAPVPNSGKRNSSLNLPYIVEEIARIKAMSCEDVTEITRRNGEKLFGIKAGQVSSENKNDR